MRTIELSKYRHWVEFLIAMTEKEIKTRYKMAFLGFLWAFLNPLLQMSLIGFVFQYFIPVRVDNYFVFLFTGLLPWNFFSYTVLKNTPMFLNERTLIQKAKFPREAIILSIVLSNLLHMIISFILLLLLIAILNYTFSVTWIFLLLPIMLLTLLTSGLSLLFASLNVRFRDINFIVQALMPLWFYGTPIIYTLNLLPISLQQILYLNPVTSIIEWIRFLIIKTPITEPHNMYLSIVIIIFTFIIGLFVFSKLSTTFDDWL